MKRYAFEKTTKINLNCLGMQWIFILKQFQQNWCNDQFLLNFRQILTFVRNFRHQNLWKKKKKKLGLRCNWSKLLATVRDKQCNGTYGLVPPARLDAISNPGWCWRVHGLWWSENIEAYRKKIAEIYNQFLIFTNLFISLYGLYSEHDGLLVQIYFHGIGTTGFIHEIAERSDQITSAHQACLRVVVARAT